MSTLENYLTVVSQNILRAKSKVGQLRSIDSRMQTDCWGPEQYVKLKQEAQGPLKELVQSLEAALQTAKGIQL